MLVVGKKKSVLHVGDVRRSEEQALPSRAMSSLGDIDTHGPYPSAGLHVVTGVQ